LGLATAMQTTGPASVCVVADIWQTYTGGVITSGCDHTYSEIDHCVQAVGVGTESGSTVWLVRNSWASSWGEAGYIWLEFGSNLCGLADQATFVQY